MEPLNLSLQQLIARSKVEVSFPAGSAKGAAPRRRRKRGKQAAGR